MQRYKTEEVPAKYTKNFIQKLDGRYQLARELRANFEELTNDLGGADSLSLVRRTLAERFVWLSAILRGIEGQLAEADETKAGELLGRWTQAVNTAIGLGKVLGLERKARKADLKSYLEGAGRQ